MIYSKEEGRWLRDWEIKGTRRPFPPLYEAVKAYGERIYYGCPNYVEPKHCKWCGKPLTGRRTSFCCDGDRNKCNFYKQVDKDDEKERD